MDRYGKEGLIVLLGSPTAESTEVYARTVTEGDPSSMGPLTGIALGLPVFHVLEPEVVRQFDPKVYKQQIALRESARGTAEVVAAVRKVREAVGV